MASAANVWRRSRLLRVAVGLAIAALLAEFGIRATHLDAQIIWPTLYFVEGDFNYSGGAEIYRPTDKPRRLYELNPGVSTECSNCVHPEEEKYRRTRISVNRLGFRGPEYKKEKTPGVRRIVLLGGSHTFGVSVSDEDTLSSHLQANLDATAPGTFEVWNAGLSAYVGSQQVAYAEEILAEYSPDMLIFESAGSGRRPFFYADDNHIAHFERERELFVENIPLLCCDSAALVWTHRRLVLASGLYRTVLGAGNRVVMMSRLQASRRNPEEVPNEVSQLYMLQKEFSPYADELSLRAWTAFLEANQEIPIVVTDHLIREDCSFRGSGSPANLQYFLACPKHKPPEFDDNHPPSHVYRWEAAGLAERVLEILP